MHDIGALALLCVRDECAQLSRSTSMILAAQQFRAAHLMGQCGHSTGRAPLSGAGSTLVSEQYSRIDCC